MQHSKGMKATVHDIVELVEYQPDSVVSKTVIDQPAGKVTLFAFDESQGLSAHIVPFDALVQVIEGEVSITISGQPHKLKAGQMIIMPANQPHAVKAVSPFKMMLVMIKKDPR